MGLIILVLLVSPDAKSGLIQLLMRTGLYNVKIEQPATGGKPQNEVLFNFTDEKGTVQSTASLRGRVVFINFWASWCPPCRAEFPSIEKLYAKFQNNPGIFFLMINEDDDWDAGKKYLQSKQYQTPLFKTASTVAPALYNGTLPTTLILDKSGNLVFRHEGFANYASDRFIQQISNLLEE